MAASVQFSVLPAPEVPALYDPTGYTVSLLGLHSTNPAKEIAADIIH